MATVAEPQLPETLVPQPEKTKLDAPIEAVADPKDLPFDPVKFKEKYLAQRTKRLRDDGIPQYKACDGPVLSHYLDDPWVDQGFTRNPVNEDVEVAIVGGG